MIQQGSECPTIQAGDVHSEVSLISLVFVYEQTVFGDPPKTGKVSIEKKSMGPNPNRAPPVALGEGLTFEAEAGSEACCGPTIT